MHFLLRLLLLPTFWANWHHFCRAYDLSAVLDNHIIGTPKVVCEESEVALDILTAKPFIGNIFVKGRAKDASCRQSFADPDNKNGSSAYTLSLGKCGMQRLRSANPRGINFAVTVVVSFHPAGFITKNDRAFHLSCFYTEPDEVVTSSFEVSQLPAQELSDHMSMPSCRYSVLHSAKDGPQLSWANVGDTVFHVWECKGPAMGMLVKKCFVTDGDGEDHAVVDEDGCSLDLGLLSEIEYSEDGTMRAFAKSQVFKYADSNQLFFTCQIRMCQRQMDQCHGITPPKCGGKDEHKKKEKNNKKHEKKDDTLIKLEDTLQQLGFDGADTDWSLDEAQAAAERRQQNGTETVSVREEEVLKVEKSVNTGGEAENKTMQQIAENEEEEEETDGHSNNHAGDDNRLKGRGRRALARQLLGPWPQMEVDVASPQMLVLDEEDQARIGRSRNAESTMIKEMDNSPGLQQQEEESMPAMAPEEEAAICVAKTQLLLGLPLGVGLITCVGALLTICMGRLVAHQQRRRHPKWAVVGL